MSASEQASAGAAQVGTAASTNCVLGRSDAGSWNRDERTLAAPDADNIPEHGDYARGSNECCRWAQQFSVDADGMNAKVQEEYARRERDARQQIMRFMDENDTHLPALAVCHGVACYPETKKLAAFTGDRFFRSLAASNRCKPSQEDASVCVPASEAAATTMLFQAIEGEARGSLAIPEMLDLVATAKFCMADSIVAALPLYYGAAMQQMNAQELAWMLAELLRHLADRADYHTAFVAFVALAADSPGVAASSKNFHAFATLLLSLLSQPGDTVSSTAALVCVAQRSDLPAHVRLLFVVALVAAASASEDCAGRDVTQPEAGATREPCSSGGAGGTAAEARASAALDESALCAAMHGVLAQTCGSACTYADVLSDLLVDTCTGGGAAAAAPLRRALLRYSHRQLFESHCTGVSRQRLELAPLGRPVVFGRTAEREMFVARLRMPCSDATAVETEATPSGWWLKVERCCGSKGVSETTYSLFLNNRNASGAAPLQAAFEIGVVASADAALRKAEAAAVLIGHAGFMRPGLWAAHEAAIHRSAIRQEFSGAAWGIRHLFNDLALARFGCAGEGGVAYVFGMVQTS